MTVLVGSTSEGTDSDFINQNRTGAWGFVAVASGIADKIWIHPKADNADDSIRLAIYENNPAGDVPNALLGVIGPFTLPAGTGPFSFDISSLNISIVSGTLYHLAICDQDAQIDWQGTNVIGAYEEVAGDCPSPFGIGTSHDVTFAIWVEDAYPQNKEQVGHTTVGTTSEAIGINYPFGNVHKFNKDGKISKLYAYLDNPSGGAAALVRAVVWPTSGGVPTGNIRAASNEVTITDGQAAGWVEFTFPTPVIVNEGESLLLGLWAGGGVDLQARTYLIDGNPTPNVNYWANHSYISTGLPPNVWTNGPNGNTPSRSFSLYAELEWSSNRILNPSFEVDLANWVQDAFVSTTFVRTSDWVSDGSWSARLTFTDITAGRNSGWRTPIGTSGIAVKPGEKLAIRADVNIVTPANGAYIRVYWYDVAGTPVAGGTPSNLQTIDGEIVHLVVPPATAAFASIGFGGQSNGEFDAYFDNIRFEYEILEGWNNFEGGTDGTTITDANSGGISGMPTFGGGHGATNVMEFDSAQARGSLSAHFLMPATVTEQSWLEWGPLGYGGKNLWFSIEYRKVANPVGSLFHLIRMDNLADVRMFGLDIRPDGFIRIDDSTGTEVTALRSTTAIPNNQWVRIEARVRPTNGEVEWWLYLDPDSDVADETKSITGLSLSTEINEILSGVISSITNMNGAEWWIDNIRWSTEGKLGPYVTSTLQKIRPDADLAATGWSTAPLWSKINEETADGVIISGVAS